MRHFLRFLGFALCIVPPLIATLDQFPLMTTEGKWSTIVIVGGALCFVPLFKHVKALLRSPSAWVMWGVIFAVCALIRPLIDEFWIISLIGFASSALGGVCFLLARKIGGVTNG